MFKKIRSYITALLQNIQGHLTPSNIGSIGPTLRGVSTNDFSNITGLRRGLHDIGTQIYYCKVFGGEAAHSHTGVSHSLTDFGKTSVLGKKIPSLFSLL